MENQVREVLESKNIQFRSHSTIKAKITASIAAFNSGLGVSMHAMKEHVLHFSDEGVVVLPVDESNGKVSKDSVVLLGNEIFDSIALQQKRFHYKLLIRTIHGDISYKVPKKALGFPEHKVNLAFLLIRLLS
ncbi:hypothetical protein A4S06_07230 [Erysipelotrichaceae bacterium MTC7]|nr:hypothetical protein A4S06_07230 [Erysipelotrichaceae bacterium MTC7]